MKKTAKKRKAPANTVDGKNHSSLSHAKTIDQVLGVAKFNQYPTTDEKQYNKALDEMVKVDLQRECLRVFLVPHDRTEVMKARLLKKFREYIAKIHASNVIPTEPKQASKKAHSILSRMLVS